MRLGIQRLRTSPSRSSTYHRRAAGWTTSATPGQREPAWRARRCACPSQAMLPRCRRTHHVAIVLAAFFLLARMVHGRLRGGWVRSDPMQQLKVVEKAEEEAFETAYLHTVSDDDAMMFEEQSAILPRVIVFGGNGFIGASIVEHLLQAGFYVIMVNRNSSYYDIPKRLQYRVHHVLWDRSLSVMQSEQLELIMAHHPVLHAVVDLSCYDAEAAYDLGTYLITYRVSWYIYLSSDSVYEVCEPHKHSGPTREEDARRPENATLREALEAADPYGHKKLQAEEALTEIREETRIEPNSWEYVFLRIPDVVGIRDTSYRWWFYQLLIKLQESVGVPLPLAKEDDEADPREMSLIYVEDVASAVTWLISGKNQRRVVDTALNLAGDETPTFKEMMADIAQGLGTNRPIRYARNETTELPSVKRGPIDTSKARRLMGSWKPTPWKDVVAEAVPWYEAAMVDPKFIKERDDVLEWVYAHVSKYGKQKALRRALSDVYGLGGTVVDRLIERDEKLGVEMPEVAPEVVIGGEADVTRLEL